MPLTLQPPPVAESDAQTRAGAEAGVIKDAQRRQRRRRAGLATVLGAAALTLGGALLSGAGGRGPAGLPAEAQPPLQLAFVHGRPYVDGYPFVLAVTPSLQPGNVGICVRLEGTGTCNGPYAGPGRPLFGAEGYGPAERVGPRGEIGFALTGPAVAAVRVKDTGTFRPVSLPGLPPGDRAVVFYRRPGSFGVLVPPGGSARELINFERVPHPLAITMTALDRSGHAIAQVPVESSSRSFNLPSSYWQAPGTPPAAGRCALRAASTATSVQWGEVSTVIRADPNVTGTAFLSCLNVWFRHAGASIEAGVLLDAQHPGRPPAPLWSAAALDAHPGIVRIPPVYGRPPTAKRVGELRRAHPNWPSREFMRSQITPETLARREGDAWVLVQGGNSRAERLAFLSSLMLTRG